MTILIVPCPHCNQPAKLDSTRLPDQSVTYPCPRCKQKVTADKRQLLEQQAAQQVQASAQRIESAVSGGRMTAQQAEQQAAPQPSAPNPPASPAAPPPEALEAVALPPSLQPDRRFIHLPDNAKFPSGVIFGDDETAIEEIQRKLAAMGSELEKVESADIARQMIITEGTELCICVGSGNVEPPYEPIQPLTGLAPDIRRLTYLALVADNVKTLDGNEAFVHQVNVVIGKPDVAQFEASLYSGIDYHNRLYRGFLQAIERKNAV